MLDRKLAKLGNMQPRSESPPRRKYNDEGMRLTDCCGCVSTYHDEDLCCKGCWEVVPHGQGDGVEYR